MNRFIILILSTVILYSCSTVPITGRKQFNMIPASEVLAMSDQQYDAFLKEHKLSKNKKAVEQVKKTGTNIEHAVTKYLTGHNMAHLLQGYDWEFNLVEDKQANAWCMPGGKVVVYTGILPITKNESGLAVVLSHEIAHAIAEHGSERMSQALIQQLGGVALSVALQNKPEETQALWLTAYGVSTQLGLILPFSRLQESEADHLGLIFMAMAGYDPHEAIKFWENMEKMNKNQKPPEFLSTHPSDQTRVENIKKWLPEAMKYYKTGKNNN